MIDYTNVLYLIHWFPDRLSKTIRALQICLTYAYETDNGIYR